jgi:glycosyltransferase involved in cell wall biosynthesis
VLLAVAGWTALPFLEHGPAYERAAFYGPFTDDAKRTLLGSAAVGLNPVTQGSGTNLKILEYFAAGVPVVSTPVGARGLEVRDGEHLRIAELDGFIDAVAAVLAAPDLSASMAERARELVVHSYAWPVVAAAFVERVAALAAAPAPVG